MPFSLSLSLFAHRAPRRPTLLTNRHHLVHRHCWIYIVVFGKCAPRDLWHVEWSVHQIWRLGGATRWCVVQSGNHRGRVHGGEVCWCTPSLAASFNACTQVQVGEGNSAAPTSKWTNERSAKQLYSPIALFVPLFSVEPHPCAFFVSLFSGELRRGCPMNSGLPTKMQGDQHAVEIVRLAIQLMEAGKIAGAVLVVVNLLLL